MEESNLRRMGLLTCMSRYRFRSGTHVVRSSWRQRDWRGPKDVIRSRMLNQHRLEKLIPIHGTSLGFSPIYQPIRNPDHSLQLTLGARKVLE